MDIHGIRLFTIGLVLAGGTFAAAQAPPEPPAGPFEALPHFEASAILSGDVLQGPNHRVQVGSTMTATTIITASVLQRSECSTP